MMERYSVRLGAIVPNGLQIGDVADFGTQNCLQVQNLI
jgi:hypothetical protein